MIQLDFSDRRPLYEQIKEKFKELIFTGAMKEQDKILSVRELASILAINPNTIQRAYKELEEEGYIYSQRAKGSFIAPVQQTQETAYVKALYKDLTEAAGELFYRGESPETVTAEIMKVYDTMRRDGGR